MRFTCSGLLLIAVASACSSEAAPPSPAPVTPAGSGGTTTGQSGSGGSGGEISAAGSSGAAGTTSGGTTSGGTTSGGSAGTGGDASGGMPSGGSGGTGGYEPGDTPPWRELMVVAAAEEHIHGSAGVDPRAKLLGKLVVDIGVNSGGYVGWLAKRGYHSMGAPCGSCPAPNLEAGREEVGNCRLDEFANTADHVKSTLESLQAQFPEEDWGYFLNEDGSVRWSDVALTGMSHGATTAAVAGRVGVRLWRVVSRSGPRDTTCGAAGGTCSTPLSTPSYDVDCPADEIAAWLDAPPITPINRFYGLVGTSDVQCGDIMFDMQYAGYPGTPTIWDVPGAVLTGTNQFFSSGGHLDFLLAADKPLNTEEVLNIAFGIPEENRNPAF